LTVFSAQKKLGGDSHLHVLKQVTHRQDKRSFGSLVYEHFVNFAAEFNGRLDGENDN
jgi:hypothetical protein